MFMSVEYSTKRDFYFRFEGELNSTLYEKGPYLEINIYRCPNDNCQRETVIAYGRNGYMKGRTVCIYPESDAIQFPDYVPASIRSDYEEACAIRTQSPKACATLTRRCLQGMIRDFWGIKKSRLIDEILALQDKIPASQWAAIDALRQIGNIGAHMEKDVNLLIDVDPEEAEKLIQLIEVLIDKWYVARNDEELLFQSISASAAGKKPAIGS